MGNKNIPFGVAIGVIMLVVGIVGIGIYHQSIPIPNGGLTMAGSMGKEASGAPVFPSVSLEKSLQTYRDDAYGFEFEYPTGMEKVEETPGDIVYSAGVSENDNWIFQVDTQVKNPGKIEFYNIPSGTDVVDWVMQSQEAEYKDEGGGYFSNKVGAVFDISGLKTLHLVSRQLQGGSHDEFYFVKDGRLFVLTIVNSPSMREDLNLNDDSQWYTQLLKSFRFTDAQSSGKIVWHTYKSAGTFSFKYPSQVCDFENKDCRPLKLTEKDSIIALDDPGRGHFDIYYGSDIANEKSANSFLQATLKNSLCKIDPLNTYTVEGTAIKNVFFDDGCFFSTGPEAIGLSGKVRAYWAMDSKELIVYELGRGGGCAFAICDIEGEISKSMELSGVSFEREFYP